MAKLTPPPGRLKKGLKPTLVGILAAIGIVTILTTLLHARVALSGATPAKASITVAVVPFLVQGSYVRSVSYLGLVAAGRRANLGFEIPGQISTAPLRQGSPVRQGDVIAMLDQSALKSRRNATAAELEQVRVELELARLKAQRQRDLQATGAVSKEAFDDTRLRARALQSTVDAVAAHLASIDIELEKSRLLAPYDGIIADRYVHQGAIVTPGTPVVRLLEAAALEAHIGVSASRAGELELGKSYPLRLRDATFVAPLLSVRPDVDPATRTTIAVFAIPPETEALDGEPVTLELQESVHQSGGWLPIAALLEGKRGVWTVLRIEAEGDLLRTVREAVEVLDIRGDEVFVRGTLTSGSTVVASGVHRISPGTVIAVADAH